MGYSKVLFFLLHFLASHINGKRCGEVGPLPMLIPKSYCKWIPYFASIAPTVCLAKVPFLT